MVAETQQHLGAPRRWRIYYYSIARTCTRAYGSFPYGNAATTNLVVVYFVSQGEDVKRRRPDNTYQHSSNSRPNFI